MTDHSTNDLWDKTQGASLEIPDRTVEHAVSGEIEADKVDSLAAEIVNQTALEVVTASAEAAARLTTELLELMPQIVAGDQRAFESFYKKMQGRAHALVRRIVPDLHAIDDVLEEAFWQVWRDAARYAPERGSVQAWFMTICRSRALDYLRRQDPAQLHPEPQTLQTDAEILHTAMPAPHELLEAFQNGSQVQQALALLPAQERQMIALAFFRDLTHQEIALSCGMPLGSVKTIMHRAFNQLRALLQHADVNTTLQ